MSLLLVFVISIGGMYLGKYIFDRWINHITLYSLIHGIVIFFYELKFIPYPEIVPVTWFFLISSFLSLLLGSLTIVAAKKVFSPGTLLSEKNDISFDIFADDGKALRYSIYFFIFIAFFVAIQRWFVLIAKFGSIAAVIINAGLVYRLNHGEIEEFIPILPSFIYVGIFLLGIYTAYRGKFSFLTFLPFIAIILKELTYFGRGEILMTLMEFFFSFFLFRYLLSSDAKQKFKFSRKNAVISIIILVALLTITASFIRVSRGSFETFSGSSKGLRSLKENFIISPSIYLYISSNIGVFTKYIEAGGEDNKFGQNTFSIFHTFLSKIKVIEKPNFFPKGYYIPMWSNSGTFLRDLHADFGYPGLFLAPYLIGLLMTWFWFKFFQERSLIVFAFLVYFFMIIGFSFLVIVTRFNQWYMSLFFIIVYIPLLEKLAIRNKNKITAKLI